MKLGSEHRVQVSAACFPGLGHQNAVAMAVRGSRDGWLREPLFGRAGTDHIQLVPQSMGLLTEAVADSLMAEHPSVRFRLHANVRLTAKYAVAEISGFGSHRAWFEQAAAMSKRLGATVYTAHAGSRREASMSSMLDNARRLQDLFGCRVGVEGGYPRRNDDLLVSTWQEYEEMLVSGVDFALDLSHLNILARRSGTTEKGLVEAMLCSPQLVEVHVSDNDGLGDQHRVCESAAWWADLLPFVNVAATIFTEGNHRRRITQGPSALE